jgi:hypothetical protein
MKQAERRETARNKMCLVIVQEDERSPYALMITARPLFPRESHTIGWKKRKEYSQECITAAGYRRRWHGARS